MNNNLRYTINPNELNVPDLYNFLVHNCKYFDVVILALMLNNSKELIEQMKKDGKIKSEKKFQEQ